MGLGSVIAVPLVSVADVINLLRIDGIEVSAIGNLARPDVYRCQSGGDSIDILISDQFDWNTPHQVTVQIPPVVRNTTLELADRIKAVLQRTGGDRVV